MKITGTSWTTEALWMLNIRDKYSKDWIITELHKKAMKGDIVKDSLRIAREGETEFFVYKTSLRNTFCVWEFNAQRNRLFVLAVSLEQPRNRKEAEAMLHQPHLGRVKLRHLWKRCKECKINN